MGEAYLTLPEAGRIFYIMESHPFFNVFDDSGSSELLVRYSYFNETEPMEWSDLDHDYSDENFVTDTPSYEWQWSMSDIINSLLSAGLKIEFVKEYNKLFYKAHPDMTRVDNGWWYLPESKRIIPLMFTLKAYK